MEAYAIGGFCGGLFVLVLYILRTDFKTSFSDVESGYGKTDTHR